jgi:SAM-dependent methyltransferase
MAIPAPSADELSGQTLYGDNFSGDQIRQWYESEVTGYFDILNSRQITDDDYQYQYGYHAFNRFHAINALLKRKFDGCLALGCAAGDDVAPLAPVVSRFVALEPSEKWWKTEIGGKPAKYMMPSALGDIALESASMDLAVSFGVLHHIPNVSHVVEEIARVLSPNGFFVVREPIVSMGDWRRPRPALTPNERGLPLEWFEQVARAKGFDIASQHLCMFNPLAIVARTLGFSRPLALKSFVKLDWMVSEALRWNVRYWRDSFVQKLAPSSAFWVLQRR